MSLLATQALTQQRPVARRLLARQPTTCRPMPPRLPGRAEPLSQQILPLLRPPPAVLVVTDDRRLTTNDQPNQQRPWLPIGAPAHERNECGRLVGRSQSQGPARPVAGRRDAAAHPFVARRGGA